MEKHAGQNILLFMLFQNYARETHIVITNKALSYFRLFERGSHHFNVVLGDANLNIDLPFGVQNHEISEVIVHENYRPEDEYHHEDIGMYILAAIRSYIFCTFRRKR